MTQVSCLVLRDVVPRCAVLQAHVSEVVARADWTKDERPCELEELGVDVPAELESERVLVLRTSRGTLPLLVRGGLITESFAAEQLSELSDRAYGSSAFSSAIIRDAAIIALLLDPNRLFQFIEP